jgi:hypothetical protein
MLEEIARSRCALVSPGKSGRSSRIVFLNELLKQQGIHWLKRYRSLRSPT